MTTLDEDDKPTGAVVIDLKSHESHESPIARKRQKAPANPQHQFCKHRRVVAYERERRLECEVCGSHVDAFEYVLDAERFANFSWAASKKRDLEAQCEELLKQIDRLKAARRRLAKQTGATLHNYTSHSEPAGRLTIPGEDPVP